MNHNINNILIIHTHGGLGDLLLSTPVFHSLKAEFPHAKITAMVKKSFVDVVSGNPKIDNIIPIPPDMCEGFKRFGEQRKMILEGKYDMAIVLWSTAREAYLTYLSGIPIRVGQAGRLLYSFMFTHKVTRRSDKGDEESHWVENQLDFVRSPGIEPRDKSIFFHIPEKAKEFIDKLLKEEGVKEDDFLIGFHSTKGLAVDGKRWPVKKFASFARGLAERFDAKVVFTGSPSEKDLVEEIRSHVPAPSLSVAGRTDIKQMGALIKRCRLFVCPDSGPMHIAAALKTPVVGIYGLKEDYPKRWAPYDCEHEIVRLDKIPCSQKCIKADCPRFSCYEAIPDDMVIDSAVKLMNRIGK
ncbi:MAG: glycosyltransferase family 9 protein [Candidatus Eremiobacteraeota bacterium]|nr:glycosyltransferase family 9 protein [Candidatus Eremiobacteraeota bacterium]